MKYLLFIIFLFYCAVANSQPQRRENTDFKLFAYNVSFGGLTAGIGAVINKPKETPIHRAFFKGFYQGCFGGALQYGGKKIVHQIVKHENYWYGLPAKLVHGAGASIVENAALNRPFGRYWNMEWGPLRLDFSFNEETPFRARFCAVIIYDIVTIGLKPNETSIDWDKSLKMGTLIFYTHEPLLGHRHGKNVVGTAYTRSFIHTTFTGHTPTTVAHELIHLFQYREHLVFNTWLTPLTSKAPPRLHNIFHNYIFIELPYITPFYHFQGYHEREDYYRNFYEYEAEWFATDGYF